MKIERNLISMRTKEALALRKAEGVVLGRKKGSYTKMKFKSFSRNFADTPAAWKPEVH